MQKWGDTGTRGRMSFDMDMEDWGLGKSRYKFIIKRKTSLTAETAEALACCPAQENEWL